MFLFFTCMNCFMTGKVALVAECCLAPVTFVWLVTVDLKHVAFQNLLFCKLGVAFVTEVCTVFCKKIQH